jgi:hypothetical protein
MEGLEKFFNHYIINARFKPALFVLMPIAITTLAWCPEAKKLGGFVLTFLITFGVMTFLSNQVSNLGNQLQDKLFEDWGGAPSTILLRHSDNILDVHTKQRYHKWLQSKLPDLIMPSLEDEARDPINADHIYASATNFLREHTRSKTKYPMIYSDNVAYGFARNLLVLRPIGIGVALVSIVLNLVLLSTCFNYYEQSLPTFVESHISMVVFGSLATIASGGLLFFYIFFINSTSVHGRAFRYAKSLLAVCEESG